jgi:hypothetical protein
LVWEKEELKVRGEIKTHLLINCDINFLISKADLCLKKVGDKLEFKIVNNYDQ